MILRNLTSQIVIFSTMSLRCYLLQRPSLSAFGLKNNSKKIGISSKIILLKDLVGGEVMHVLWTTTCLINNCHPEKFKMPKLCEASEPWPINECLGIIQMTENHSNLPKNILTLNTISKCYSCLRSFEIPVSREGRIFLSIKFDFIIQRSLVEVVVGLNGNMFTGLPGMYQGLVWMVPSPFGTSLGNTLRIIAWCDRGGGKKRCILGVNFIGFSVFYISTHVFISTHV